MRDEYEFDTARPNPYAAQLTEPVSIDVDEEVLVWFRAMAAESGIPYLDLMGLYLRDCARSGRKLDLAGGEAVRDCAENADGIV